VWTEKATCSRTVTRQTEHEAYDDLQHPP